MVTNYEPSKDVIVTTSGKVLGGVLRALRESSGSARTEMLASLRTSSNDGPDAPPSFESMLPALREKGMVR